MNQSMNADIPPGGKEYRDALNAVIDADNAFAAASIAEIRRLMPDHVAVVHVEINDTPRLAVRDWLDADGESVLDDMHPAYDAMDDVAASIGWREWDDADSWLLRVDGDNTAWKIEREEEVTP